MATKANVTHELRIRSGGQTGVDRAALDAAIATARTYEGWCPKGGWAEDFPDPPGLLTKYPLLLETPSEFPGQRTEWNVRDSAATVVLVPDANYRSKGTSFTIDRARKYRRPCTVICYLDDGAADYLRDVICRMGEGTSLNIAGPRESEHQGTYNRCLPILVKALEFRCGKSPARHFRR